MGLRDFGAGNVVGPGVDAGDVCVARVTCGREEIGEAVSGSSVDVDVIASLASASVSMDCAGLRIRNSKVVGDVGTDDLVGADATTESRATVSAVTGRVRVVCRGFGVGTSVACPAALNGNLRQGETVHEALISIITAARSSSSISYLLQAPALDSSRIIQQLNPSAMAVGI